MYLNFFDYDDHIRIGKLISDTVNSDWIITYDDEPEIEKIYKNYCVKRIGLNYSVAEKKKANELVIFKSCKSLPDDIELLKRNIRLS